MAVGHFLPDPAFTEVPRHVWLSMSAVASGKLNQLTDIVITGGQIACFRVLRFGEELLFRASLSASYS
jgi:hypothetical protein